MDRILGIWANKAMVLDPFGAEVFGLLFDLKVGEDWENDHLIFEFG